MRQRRDDLMDMCVERMRQLSPEHTDSELREGFAGLLNEIIAALEREDGIPADSPLPGRSESAAHFGRERQRRRFSIGSLALHLGSISDSIGALGTREGMAFSAYEYRVFNQCLDMVMSTAVEEYARQARQQQEEESVERIGFLAHELRNALHSARMAFSLMKNGQISVQSKTGEVLERSLARLEALIGQTLLTARLRAGIEPDRTPLPVDPLLHDLAETATLERGSAIRVEAEPDLYVLADHRLLVSAISNLLQNAIKFSHDHASIVLRASQQGSALVIEVEDECGGLPEGKIEELFAPHVQKSNDRRGFGLGLAITREAIELQHGKISVRNLPGKGCVFAVRLEAGSDPHRHAAKSDEEHDRAHR